MSLLIAGAAHAQCTAQFQTTGPYCEGSAVGFQALDSGNTVRYDWNFGDIFSGNLNTDTVRQPTHIFTGNGVYTVRLIVRDTGACNDTFTARIRVYARPQANFKVANACALSAAHFTDVSVADSGDRVSLWSWDFGNGSKATAKDTFISYNSTGTYTIRLLVQSDQNCRDTLIQNLVIYKKPTGSSNLRQACKNSQIQFTADTLSKALGYFWDFGDSSFFSARLASHVYTRTGFIFPVLTVNYGTTQCKTDIDSILIHNLPDADFTVPSAIQCFDGNRVCIKTKTGRLKARNAIFDDGYFDDFSPLTDTLICHSYTDPKGGSYHLTLELTDSNNCFSSFTLTHPVVIHPELKADFSSSGNNGCDQTQVTLTNRSNVSPSGLLKYVWNFGDSTADSTQWTAFNHVYHTDGSFTIRLTITDTNGCTSSFTDSRQIINTRFTIDAYVDSSNGKCYNNNIFTFKQTPVPGAFIRWDFTPADSSNLFTSQFHYNYPGRYFPSVTLQKNGCKKVVALTPLQVYGPAAAFGNIVNRYQCQVKDTVYFENNSYLFKNRSARVLWDSGDPYAQACTTDTRRNVNVSNNCRYSSDSLYFKHMYSKGREACYYVKLTVIDTVVGCRDSAWAGIPLMAPVAKGLFTPSVNTPCPGPEAGKSVTFNLNQSQPTCAKYSWKVMWDSLGAIRTGNFDSCWVQNAQWYNFQYGVAAGDSNGNVTMGLIVENGTDTNGRTCRDTGWFHNIANVLRLNPNFTSNYNPKQYYCINSVFRFFPADSNQSKGNRFMWSFGDGTFLDTTHQGSVAHTFTQPGYYRVYLRVSNPGGCWGDTSMRLSVGVFKQFTASRSQACAGDTLMLREYNRYAGPGSGPTPFWSDSARYLNGKEEIRYDLNDGKGFQNLGPNPVISYAYPGAYSLRMAVKDSAGCWDTLTTGSQIGIGAAYARFSLPQDSVLCGQTLDLKSASSTTDSVTMKSLPGDRITTWQWDFGNRYPKSSIPNPRRFFAIGDYTIKLKVTNTTGCSDSVTDKIVFIGPRAAFDFISDTIGCEPLQIRFANKSKDATDYIWQFNDALNSAYVTDSDTAVSFVYRGAGNFYPTLIARGLFSKGGVDQMCDDYYPDTSLSFKRTVTVWELPKPNFTWVTNCTNATTTFRNTGTIGTGTIVSQVWNFGDGSTSTLANPVHTYADTGYYRVVLTQVSDHGCTDSIVKTVVVSLTPFAGFTFTEVCQGLPNLFRDSSFAFNDRIYLWQWDFGDGSRSLQRNPSKVYASDTLYKVQLKVTNVAGCSDSISKWVAVHSNPAPDFGFANVCDGTPMYFSNQTVSKQGVSAWLWDFGDSTTSVSYSDSHLYQGPANYTVKLKATTVKGCSDSVLKSFSVHPNPVAGITIPGKSQCLKNNGFTLISNARILSGSIRSDWDLGDGSSASADTVQHVYAAHGKYRVRLISVSGFNCRDTAYDSVTVFAMPSVKPVLNQDSQCVRSNLFSLADTGNIRQGTYGVKWDLGNGDTAWGSQILYRYSDTGWYTIRLTALSDRGCTDTASLNVQLLPMPSARFDVNDTGQCLTGNRFVLTNRSVIPFGPLRHVWNFGDGSGYIGPDTAHSFNTHGVYTVTLISESYFGCRDTLSKIVEVHPMPRASFTIDDSLQCLAGNRFEFTDQSSLPYGSLTYNWTFGDSTQSAQQNPVHSYLRYGNFNPVLILVSDAGCADTLGQSVEVFPMPQAIPLVNQNNQCINNQSYLFSDSSRIAYGTLSRRWNFGDQTISVLAQPVKTYAKDSTYTVWLKQTSDKACVDSAFLSLTVYPKPMPSFKTNDSGQCLTGNAFLFTNTSTINSGTFSSVWQYGDGSSQSVNQGSHAYLSHGNYRVTLTLNSNFGCRDSVSDSVFVHPMPFVSFTVNNNEQCIRGNQFAFTNNSSIVSGTLSYNWNFGDTGRSVQAAPVYIYNRTGSFFTRLKATSNHGCIDSANDVNLVNPMPKAGFSINDTGQCYNRQNFIFTDTSKIANGIMSRVWHFGDGTVSFVSQPLKTYGVDSFYQVKLVQTSARGCKDSINKWIEVYPAPNLVFTVNDTDQCLRQNRFVFQNTSSIKKGILNFQWDFGDKTGSNNPEPVKRYTAFGSYVVQLSSLSDLGCTDTIRQTMRVDPMPLMSFSVNDTGQCVNNQNFVFTNKMSVAVGSLSHVWRFGDGAVSLLMNPSHVYAKDSFYTVTLSGQSNKGCRDSTVQIMAVYPKPVPKFSIDDTVQCLFQNRFNFNNLSSIRYGTLSYLWQFRDGNTDNAANSAHSYARPGFYHVGLTASSDLGCTDTTFVGITVGAMPGVGFTVNDRGQCLRAQNFVFTATSSVQGGTLKHYWFFGDGDSASKAAANHRYKSIGTYAPKLISESNLGCRDSLSRIIWVNPNAKASFTINDSDQCLNQQNYQFTNTSTVSPGSIKSLYWEPGSGGTSTLPQVNAFYPVSGTYRVLLQTTTDSNCVDSAIQFVKVYPKPASWFSVNDSAQCLYGNQYVFTDNSFDTLGVNQYVWNINNESIQTVKQPTYTFVSPGFKQITLIAISSRGCSDTAQRQVYVKPMPDPLFEPLKKYYCEYTGPYTFVPNTAGGTFSGKNIQANLYNPVILWEDTVHYKVTVNGCTDSSYQITNVYPLPQVDLGNDTVLCKYELLEPDIQSWQSTYYWNTGSDKSRIEILKPGIYTVVVSNICGIAYDTIKVDFRDVNCRFFLPTAFSPNGDGINDFYKPVVFNVSEMNYQIFSRWGELLYEGGVNDAGWDGTYLGTMAQEDAYLVYVSYTYPSGNRFIKITEKGTFILLR